MMGRFAIVVVLCVAACKVPNAHRDDVDASLSESCGDGVIAVRSVTTAMSPTAMVALRTASLTNRAATV